MKFDKITRRAVLEKSNGVCWYCGVILMVIKGREKVTSNTYAIDHVNPQAAVEDDLIYSS